MAKRGPDHLQIRRRRPGATFNDVIMPQRLAFLIDGRIPYRRSGKGRVFFEGRSLLLDWRTPCKDNEEEDKKEVVR